MAVKSKKAKAKRAAPKREVAGKAPRVKAKAKPKAKAKAKPKPKPPTTRTPKRGGRVRTVASPPPERFPIAAVPAAELDLAEPTKKGPLARLASGVGSLFARVTAKKPPP